MVGASLAADQQARSSGESPLGVSDDQQGGTLRIDIDRRAAPDGSIRDVFKVGGIREVSNLLSSIDVAKLTTALSASPTLSGTLVYAGSSHLQQVVTEDDKKVLQQSLKDPARTVPITWSTPTSAGCAAAAAELRQFGVPDELSAADMLANAGATAEAISRMASFDSNCLGSIQPPEWPLDAPDWVQQTRPDLVLGVLATVDQGKSSPSVFCSALLISAQQVLTARHCFYSRETAAPLPGRVDALVDSRVVLIRASNPIYGQKVQGFAKPPAAVETYLNGELEYGSFTAERDFLVLNLSVPLAGVPPVHFREPALDESLWLAGPFALSKSIMATSSRSYSAVDPLAIRWTRSASCQVIAVAGQCLRHTCQTLGRFSGSPIFAKAVAGRPANEITVVGMHLGASGSGGCADVDRRAAGKGNLGLSATTLAGRTVGWISH
jgi:V8-like Glu-specific endopeptidase